MKNLSYFLFIALMSFTSCADKEGDPSPEDLIIGSWGYASITYNGKPIKQGFSEEYSTRWIFNPDGTYVLKSSQYSEISEGTWKVNGNCSKMILRDAQFGQESVWDLVDANESFLKVRTESTSEFDHSKTVAEFDMVHAY